MKKCFLALFLFTKIVVVFGQFENELIPYRLKDKWGYCDVKGKIKIKPVYEKALLFTIQGFAIIKKNGKYGIIDKNGKYTCKPKFELLSYGKKENNELDYYFVVNYKYRDFSNKHIVNHKGERIMLSGWSGPDQWRCGGVVRSNFENYFLKDKESFENKVIRKDISYLNFLNIKQSEDYYFYFTINKDTFIYLNKGQGRSSTGILNSQHKEIIPFKYQRIEEYQGLFKVFPEGENDGYFGLYTTTGIELLSPHEVLKLNDSSLLLIENGNKFGVFDLKKLAIILPVKYDKIILLKENKFLVSNHHIYSSSLDYHNFRNYRLINQLDKPITDTVFKEIILKDNQDSNFFIANTSEGWNKFNLLGKKMFKESYNKLVYSSQNNDSNKFNYNDDLFIVSKFNNKGEKKYGVINFEDSIHVPFEYDEIEACSFKSDLQGFFLKNHDFKNNMLLAKNDNKCGIITSENQILVPLIYKKLDLVEFSPFAYVELENGKTGYINYFTGVEYFKD